MIDTKLYDSDPVSRVEAAKQYRVFPDGVQPPARWREQWTRSLGKRDPLQGEPWPEALAQACSPVVWPNHAFGTANASILVLLHRPGVEKPGAMAAPWINPHTPILGGVGHAHVERFVPDVLPSDRTWDLLHHWLGKGLRAFGLDRPWAAVMVACLNDEPAVTGRADTVRNRTMLAPGGRVETICSVVRPLLVLACGRAVHAAIQSTGWSPPGATVVFVDHPSAWEGYGSGRRQGPELVAPLLEAWGRKGRLEARSVQVTPAARPASRSRALLPERSAAIARDNVNGDEAVRLGPPRRSLSLQRSALRAIVERGQRLVRRGVDSGLLTWEPERASKRYALFVGFAGVGQPITDAQCRDLAGIVHGYLQGRADEDWEELKHEGHALSIGWAATSRRNSNPNRGFVVKEGDELVCPLW